MGINWLITGGCGFIGRNLVKNLLDEGGHHIKVVDNFSVGTPKDLSMVCDLGAVQLVEGDILDADLMTKAAKGMDVMVHLAANTGVAPSVADPKADCHTNVIGTLNSLEAARAGDVKRFVFASSGAPAGECDPPISEKVVPRPVSPYGASKLAGEGYCSAYFRSFGIETVALRFGNVYGPNSGHKDSVVAKFIKRIMEEKPLEIYGDGSQTRDFIYIGDLVRAVRQAAVVEGIGGEIFQIAANHETTVKEVSDIIISEVQKTGNDRDIKVFFSERRIGDVLRNYSDTSKAGKMLKWQAETSLEQGIEKTIQWFLKHYNHENGRN